MIVLGLTGAIASGKSTTAAMLAERGIPVFSADDAVHDLYRGPAVASVGKAFPGTVKNGAVDRRILGEALARDPAAIARLEALIHPLVGRAERRFIKEAKAAGQKMVVLDYPLLFETGADKRVDHIIVTTAPAPVRRERALSRPRMSPKMYRLLSARQLTDREKRARADYVVDTGRGLDAARDQLDHILGELAALPIARRRAAKGRARHA